MKITAFFLLAFTLINSCENNNEGQLADVLEEPEEEPEAVEEEFGYILNGFEVVRDTVQQGETFGTIMDRHGVSPAMVYRIVESVKDTVNVSMLRAGKPYMFLKEKDTTDVTGVFIYQPNLIDYKIVDFRDSIKAAAKSFPVTVERKVATGVIKSSLSRAMDEEGLSQSVIHELSDIFQWSVDFFRLQKGDHFKLIYNERYVNDTLFAGIESIEVAVLNHRDKPHYGFRFVTDSVEGKADYYDEEAKTLRNFFLKAPLKYTRISSRYSLRRFHPVQKRYKAHLGTDYAAPHGTPIMSTANGVVEKSGYTSGNGNYVKVRHNNTYATQYLHMSRRAVKVGQRVSQGDIIGYVGSTGLATGPHVCYRFWMNGKQVDPYAVKLPAPEPIKEALKESYFTYIAPLKDEIDAVPDRAYIPEDDEIAL